LFLNSPQNFDALGDHFGADAVAGQDSDGEMAFHDDGSYDRTRE
jgi:hypothetical protein